MKHNHNDSLLERESDMLKAIAHPDRIRIIHLLAAKHNLSVSEIFHQLGLEQAVVSQHLRILKDRNVLNCRKDGKNRLYSLKNHKLEQLIQYLDRCCQ